MDNTPVQPTTPAPVAEQAPQAKPPSSKPPWIIVAILLIALGLLGGYMLKGSATSPSSQKSTSTAPTSAEEVTPTSIPTPTITMTTYTSTQLTGNSLKPYTIMFPQDFVKDVKHDTVSDTLTLSKDANKIVIYQAAFGGGGCTFEGTPQPMSEDLTSKKFVQVTSGIGTLRRYEADSQQSKPGITTFAFCVSTDGKTYGKPTGVGAITYELPQGYQPEILTEMDTIIKTLTSAK